MYSSVSAGSGSQGFCRDSERSAGAEPDIVLADTFGRWGSIVPRIGAGARDLTGRRCARSTVDGVLMLTSGYDSNHRSARREPIRVPPRIA